MDIDRRAMFKIAASAALAVSVDASAVPGVKDVSPPIPPITTEFVYEAVVSIGPAVQIGPTAHGIRRYIPITGGTFAGPRIKGVVLPGGADWQTERADGVTEVSALYSMRTDDGAVIIVRNNGLIAGAYFKTVPQFDAPRGPHEWLNKAVFVGAVAGVRPGAVVVRVFQVV